MTRFEYNRKMAWASFWLHIWGLLEFFGFEVTIGKRWSFWIMRQTGFCANWRYEDLFTADQGDE